jgi:regulator of cell morphogenesis and NO signaling
MTNDKYKELTVGEIVANDFRAAEIFKNANIDFCCGGNKSLSQSCIEKGIDTKVLEDELTKLELLPPNQSLNFKEWDPGFLCDYIQNTHHKYVLKTLPELVHYTLKLASVHGPNHPELHQIAGLITVINEELLKHLKKEEEVLFPAIKKALAENTPENKAIIKSEIARMSQEHEFAGGSMDKINIISNNYSVPADGCNTYHVGFKLLHQFEDDLHVHVHLENNILYKKALELAE